MSRRIATSGAVDSWVLRDGSLELHPGALTPIVGPSGAGKTSLLYCLSGLDRPDAGTVDLDGADATGCPDRSARCSYGRRWASCSSSTT